MKNVLIDLCREFIGNVEELVREQVKQEVLYAIEHPSQSKMRRENLTRSRRGKTVSERIKKRTAGDIKQQCDAVELVIIKNPGQGIEFLAKHMGLQSKELVLPIRKLLAAKRISRRGDKRATRYSPA